MQSGDPTEKVPQDVVAIFHAAFHPTQGNVIDWALKASDDLDLTHVEFSCLPSGLHLVDRDVVYFTKDEYSGVCVFHRRKTREQGHRGFRLSSVGILLAKSPRPRPWRHVPALKALVHSIYSSVEDRDTLVPLDDDWEPARAFFEERKVRRADLGGAGDWRGWDAELEGRAADSNPAIHLSHVLRILGPSCLTLYKHILGRRRILIYTLPPVEAACILCQVAADICYEDQAATGANSPDDDGDGSPRKLKGKSRESIKVLGMVTLTDLDKLEMESKTGRGWIACTTDAIFLEKPSCYDLIIDLRTSTPNTRPAFCVSKSSEHPNGRGPSYRLSAVRFTWSDVKLWTELDRLLQLDTGDHPDSCCDPSTSTGKPRTSVSSAWTDVWRVYEDVCVICAGLWMGSWRAHSISNPRVENWGSIRLEGNDDDVALSKGSFSYVRTVGLGIEGRPVGEVGSSTGRTLRGMRRSSAMSIWTWSSTKGDGQAAHTSGASASIGSTPYSADIAVLEQVDDDETARRDRRVLTTLALLQTFRTHTSMVLARLANFLPQPMQAELGDGGNTVVLTPKDVTTFDLGPFSVIDARFVEWLGEEYSGGFRVIVRRSWRDLVGLVLGFG
ncbi:hypothetical protein B0H21DRAFT_742241 [Amylocystis lapponica]|nr:hypothetical protein B0H21DRAFT_742241 [Amylocystis lapponica]